MNLFSDSKPSQVYAYPRFAYDEGCQCALCAATREQERRLAELVEAASGMKGEAKRVAWAAIRVAKRERDEIERAALERHRGKEAKSGQ